MELNIRVQLQARDQRHVPRVPGGARDGTVQRREHDRSPRRLHDHRPGMQLHITLILHNSSTTTYIILFLDLIYKESYLFAFTRI